MRARESGPAGRRRRTVVVVVVVAVLAVAGGLVARAMWPEEPAPILSDAKVHPPAPADPDGAGRTCEADELDVRLAADRATVTTGQPVVFTVTLKNAGPTPCLVDGGDVNRPVTVWAGEAGPDAERVWSSRDCDDEGERMLLLGPGSVDTQEIRWSDVRSAPGCERVDEPIRPGIYSAQVTVADVGGASSQVVELVRPEPPRPSPSPSRKPSNKDEPSASPGASPSASPSPSPSDTNG
ncbi:DUF4232 domain-containing protein [Myceligenerans xiligouense]|uniref:Putative repeat protein (TIGR01451 family) n=1 Tax=Myceligenerans xiligouense TaxID=253184 RepID=A0A3N4YWJ5_9MICO|nr:DUF4232 domain-containing protein [Myceligenerans xiligouense]RPF23030.1 putative repeat protein (TIGR01451 family) [Myceligenerans xiligouense]